MKPKKIEFTAIGCDRQTLGWVKELKRITGCAMHVCTKRAIKAEIDRVRLEAKRGKSK